MATGDRLLEPPRNRQGVQICLDNALGRQRLVQHRMRLRVVRDEENEQGPTDIVVVDLQFFSNAPSPGYVVYVGTLADGVPDAALQFGGTEPFRLLSTGRDCGKERDAGVWELYKARRM